MPTKIVGFFCADLEISAFKNIKTKPIAYNNGLNSKFNFLRSPF